MEFSYNVLVGTLCKILREIPIDLSYFTANVHKSVLFRASITIRITFVLQSTTVLTVVESFHDDNSLTITNG